jgi:hypothetical protein
MICEKTPRHFMRGPGGNMKPEKNEQGNETKIFLQVGELRIKNNGDIVIDNPELELAGDDSAADATLVYRFDPKAGVHVSACLIRSQTTST